jgi:hypothetical protein
MKTIKLQFIFFAILLIMGLWSCEEIITIDLNTASPRLTVTAIVTDQPGPYTVSLSKSESYFSSNNSFPTVSHAVVTISDNAGNTETLKEAAPGNYQTTVLRGVNGRIYHLKIVSEGITYEASSYLPFPVALDSVTSQKLAATGPHSNESANSYYVKCYFKDPSGSSDFYRIESIVASTDSLASYYQIYSDEVTDGQKIAYPLQRPTFKIGETATIELYHINADNYDYYKTANNILRNKKGPMASASAPQANPMTNISGGAVGYFGTFAVSRKVMVVN